MKLTLQSDAAIKQLEKDREEGEKILRLAEMCRKLETEEEKVRAELSHKLYRSSVFSSSGAAILLNDAIG